MSMNQKQKDAALALLNDVAQSEHHLRHVKAFAEIVAAMGFELIRHPHKHEVVDPNAPKPEPEPAPEEPAKPETA